MIPFFKKAKITKLKKITKYWYFHGERPGMKHVINFGVLR